MAVVPPIAWIHMYEKIIGYDKDYFFCIPVMLLNAYLDFTFKIILEFVLQRVGYHLTFNGFTIVLAPWTNFLEPRAVLFI
jgi:hypothetical protein